MSIDDPLTRQVIGLAMRVHTALGPGFLESVYRRALLYELRRADVACEEGKRITVFYEGEAVGEFVADIVIDGRVLVELKAVEILHSAHEVQTVNYLKATGIDVGLLLNFGTTRLQIRRKFRQSRRHMQQTEDPVDVA
jgi:GxxExxY protein